VGVREEKGSLGGGEGGEGGAPAGARGKGVRGGGEGEGDRWAHLAVGGSRVGWEGLGVLEGLGGAGRGPRRRRWSRGGG